MNAGWHSQCGGKTRYHRPESAWRTIRNFEMDSSEVAPYRCHFCRKWHIGHEPDMEIRPVKRTYDRRFDWREEIGA